MDRDKIAISKRKNCDLSLIFQTKCVCLEDVAEGLSGETPSAGNRAHNKRKYQTRDSPRTVANDIFIRLLMVLVSSYKSGGLETDE